MVVSGWENLVLAGGGCRCLWQLGFLTALHEKQPLAPKRVAAVSAGSCMASIFFSDKTQTALDVFTELSHRNQRNFYLKNLFNDRAIFPQSELYHQAMADIFEEADLNKLKSGPEIRIQLSRIPSWLGPKSSVLAAISCYQIDKYIFKRLHPKLTQKLGYTAEIISLADHHTLSDLFELILCSSATPPFTPICYYKNQVSLDGGFVDNTPVTALSQEEEKQGSLVLLTRHYRKLPQHPYRIYIQPSEKIRIDKWDYTNPKGIKTVFELGLKDGKQYASTAPTQSVAC